MSFKTLEDRFNEKVNDIYAAAQLKFEGGLPSTSRFDDPLLTRRPGDGQFGIKQEGRSLPFASAPRDLKRITLFTLSPSGLLFLAKQQLLQTGNTFEHTRLINPVFVIGNTIPFLHLKRNARITRELFGKTDTSTGNLRKMGGLQKETYDSFSTKSVGLLAKVFSPITNTVSSFTSTRSVIEGKPWEKQRPELTLSTVINPSKSFVYGGKVKEEDYSGPYNAFQVSRYGIGEGGISYSIAKYFKENNEQGIREYDPGTVEWIEYKKRYLAPNNRSDQLTTLYGSITEKANEANSNEPGWSKEFEIGKNQYETKTNEYFQEETAGSPKGEITTQPFLKYFLPGKIDVTLERGSKISYIKDPLNVENQDENNRLLQPYNKLPTVQEEDRSNDPIIVSFAMGRDDHVQFRAFLTNLKEDASPQYNEQQYIGRIEKFITYSGVQRTISFDLALIAFSKDELEVVWKRINYLTGMVFPYGFNKGIMQPNIIRLSIGNVYRDQPGYITSLSKDFNNPSDTWDIDSEVPIGAVASISFNIIEKATKIASSPFYGINEKGSPENGFRTSLTDTDPNATVN